MNVIILKQYDDPSPDAQYLAKVGREGGLIQDSFIVSNNALCLGNNNAPLPDGADDPGIPIKLRKVALQGSPVWGADWAMRGYGWTVDCDGLYVANIGPVLPEDGKPEGHGPYYNPTGPQRWLNGITTGCAGNAFQLAVRRAIDPAGVLRLWERGAGCDSLEIGNWQFIQNHRVMSDHAGALISLYALGPNGKVDLHDLTVDETMANVFQKPGAGSMGLLNVTPNYGQPPEGWTQADHTGEYVQDLIQLRHSAIRMRAPSQDTCFINGVKRLAVLNNVFDFAGDIGQARVNLDPVGHVGGKVREIVVAGNVVLNAAGKTVPVKIGGKELTYIGEHVEWHWTAGVIVVGGTK